MMNEKWFELSISQIEKKLKTNAALGLSRKAARSRVNKNQGNVFLIPRRAPLSIIGELFSDFALILLMFASLLSLFFEEYRTGALIVSLLFVNLAIAFLGYYYSLRTMEGMCSHFYPKARVIRGGKLFYSDGRTLVPGDVILLEQGDVLCCDARLVHSHDLSVRMRVDREQYTDLEKYASGFVRPQEHRPWEMTNMVHAGSIVLKGSARAIVTDVGKYTYLGALTNGISLPFSSKNPEHLIKLRKQCAKWNLILLLTVLPLTLISLLIGHFFGGTVLLSGAFLTSMSIVATGGTQLFCTLGSFFYVRKIHVLRRSANPSVVRSVDTFERLAHIDYLFVLDGAALSDGIWHYCSAYTADGKSRNFINAKGADLKLCELVALYYSAATETVSTGVGIADGYGDGIQEFLSSSRVDRDALRIRCNIISYLPGHLNSEGEKLCISDRGHRFWMSVTTSSDVLNRSMYAFKGNSRKIWSAEERNAIIDRYRELVSDHQIPLIFSLISDDGSDQELCFVGMISLKEGIDEKRTHHIRALQRLGCRVILFTSQNQKPAIPLWGIREKSVSKQDFLSRNLPITYGFGNFSWYRDFQSEDIRQLLNHVHEKKQTVALLTFSEEGVSLSDRADLMISCAPIYEEDNDRFTREIVSVDVPGFTSSTSCTQTVKERADILIPRPSKGRGGLGSLVSACHAANRAYANFSDFLRYLLGMQIVRLILVLIPMLSGKPILDARHIVFCGCILDCMAFFVLAQRSSAQKPTMKDYGTPQSMKEYLRGDRPLITAVLFASCLTLILPNIMGMMDLFGTYLYKTEFCFTSMILIHLVALIAIRYPTAEELKSVYRNYLIIAEWIGVCLLLLGCYTDSFIGDLFGLEKNPLPYFILSGIPALVFFLIMLFPSRKKQKKKKTE